MGSDTGEAQAQVSYFSFPGRLHCGVGEAMAHEDVAGRFDERFTCRSQAHRPGASFEQLSRQFDLQTADESAEGRLGYVKSFGSPAEVKFLSEDEERSEVLSVHTGVPIVSVSSSFNEDRELFVQLVH